MVVAVRAGKDRQVVPYVVEVLTLIGQQRVDKACQMYTAQFEESCEAQKRLGLAEPNCEFELHDGVRRVPWRKIRNAVGTVQGFAVVQPKSVKEGLGNPRLGASARARPPGVAASRRPAAWRAAA